MSVSLINIPSDCDMLTELPTQARRTRNTRKGHSSPQMTFKTQLLMTFTILVIITIFVLMISLMATRNTRPRAAARYRRRQIYHRSLYNHAMRKRSPDEESEEDEINVDPLASDIDNSMPVVDMHDYSESLDSTPEELPVIQQPAYLCTRHKQAGAMTSRYVILFTYIPTTISNMDLKYAINTVKMWAILDSQIQTVIYVPSNLNKTTLEKIYADSCESGIAVELVDKVVVKSHATMRTLFEQSYKLYNATWYGYAEYGTLFDSSLYPALKMLANCPNITRKGNLVLGQSHSMELRDWDPSITSELDIDTVLEHINTFTVIDEDFLGNGIHYYFTMRYGFPWDKIPAVIPGSDHLDRFLMWYTMKNTSIAGVDATDAIFTLHQNDLNITDPSTHSKTIQVYNEATITKAKYPLYYKKGLGVISCIEYVLDNKDSPYHILTKRYRKYIRRVVKGKPVNLSYYCKISKTERLALVEKGGIIINRHLEK